MVDQIDPFLINIEENLLDESKPFSPQFLQIFSDIIPEDMDKVKDVWPKASQQRKITLLQELESLMRVDTLINCDEFAFFALEDGDPLVKTQAINLLWENADLHLASRYIELMDQDLTSQLTAAAASGLGKFVLLGELDEIPDKPAGKILAKLLDKFITSNNQLVKQSILESVGYVNNAQVQGFIKDALDEMDKDWRLSALFAIGRSANKKWAGVVIENIDDSDPDFQLEAIKAAGELEITDAKETIIQIVQNTSPEDEIHLQSIWSLSMIGGNDVQNFFTQLINTSDSIKEIDMLELAMDNLELTNSFDEMNFYSEE